MLYSNITNATAFVWPIFNAEENASDSGWFESDQSNSEIVIAQQQQRLSVLSDYSDIAMESSFQGEPINHNKKYELHHYIRFFTRAGIEVDMCAHATLGK